MSELTEQMEAARQAWIAQQRNRVQRGMCIMCGQSIAECWCGHGDEQPYKPSSDGEDDDLHAA